MSTKKELLIDKILKGLERLKETGYSNTVWKLPDNWDWADVQWMAGHRRDAVGRSIRRECAYCHTPIYLPMVYPHDVATICNECAIEEYQEEAPSS